MRAPVAQAGRTNATLAEDNLELLIPCLHFGLQMCAKIPDFEPS